MTVSTTTIKNSYSGNGSTTAFSYTFKVFASSEVKVIVRTDSSGAESVRAEGSGSTNYAVTGVGEAGGGTVTFVTAPASGETVVILRDTALTQATDYQPADPFPAESHEDALDKLTHITQEIQEELDRSFKVSRTNAITTPEFVDSASTRASKLLGFSSDGNTLQATTGRVSSVSVSNVAVSGGASQAATVSFDDTTGALSLGIPVGSTGATGATGAAAVFSEIAAQAEAEGGTNNVKGMTPLRVKQAVDSYGLLASNNLSDVTASTARTNLGLAIGSDVQAHDADTLKADTADELTAGFSSAAEDAGTKSSGTFTPSPDGGNFQHFTNGGAHTLGVPAKNCAMVLLMKNNSSAGTLTTSGYTKVDGDDLSTTNGDEFFLYVTRYNDGSTSFSALTVKALQ